MPKNIVKTKRYLPGLSGLELPTPLFSGGFGEVFSPRIRPFPLFVRNLVVEISTIYLLHVTTAYPPSLAKNTALIIGRQSAPTGWRSNIERVDDMKQASEWSYVDHYELYKIALEQASACSGLL